MGALGVEPRTSSLSATRSNQLSYAPENVLNSKCCAKELTYNNISLIIYYAWNGKWQAGESEKFCAIFEKRALNLLATTFTEN